MEVRKPEVYADSKRRLGMVPGLVRAVARVPWLAELVIRIVEKPHSYASQDVLDQTILVATQENACRYCYGAQRAVMRLYGYADTEITQLAERRELGELSPARRQLLGFARQLARANPRPAEAELSKLIDAGVDPHAVAEVVFYVAFACCNNRIGTFLAPPNDDKLERLPDTWFARLFRWTIRRYVRKRAQPPIPPPEADGPFSAIVAALGDSPTAAVLAEALTGALESEVLPLRAKALMFAVIAHGLGCAQCEARSRQQLDACGLGASDVDDVLANLGSPRLDELESLLVRYARETIRYEPATIQHHTRELADTLGPKRTIEAVGVTALANAVVRLGMLLQWSPPSSP